MSKNITEKNKKDLIKILKKNFNKNWEKCHNLANSYIQKEANNYKSILESKKIAYDGKRWEMVENYKKQLEHYYNGYFRSPVNDNLFCWNTGNYWLKELLNNK